MAGGGNTVAGSVTRAPGAGPRQVALAFLVRSAPVLAIPKASSAAHAEDNAQAGSLTLDAGQLVRLDAAFPRGAKPRHLPMI